MITVITGTPGSGKTLYAIQELLLPLIGASIKIQDDDGNVQEVPRTIWTNINGLQVDHELIDGRDGGGLGDWHKWAPPGAVIVFDEFQKAWPPRPNGSKVPDNVQALDTHRHMGVDFILITQNLNNVDRHVVGLVGRHLHVRRLGNMPLATVYEWDHASRSLMYSKAFSKKPFRYKRSTYKLYRSAKAHTKMPRSIPSVVWLLLAGAAAASYVWPSAYARIKERMEPAVAASSSSSKVTSSTTTVTQGPPPGMVLPGQTGGNAPGAPGAAAVNVVQVEPPTINGCISIAAKCKCFTSSGIELDQDKQICESLQVQGAPGAIGKLAAERTYFTPPPSPAALHF